MDIYQSETCYFISLNNYQFLQTLTWWLQNDWNNWRGWWSVEMPLWWWGWGDGEGEGVKGKGWKGVSVSVWMRHCYKGRKKSINQTLLYIYKSISKSNQIKSDGHATAHRPIDHSEQPALDYLFLVCVHHLPYRGRTRANHVVPPVKVVIVASYLWTGVGSWLARYLSGLGWFKVTLNLPSLFICPLFAQL